MWLRFSLAKKKATGKVNNLWTTVNKLRVIHKQDFLFPFGKKQSNCFSTFPPGGKGSCQNLFHKKRRFQKNILSTKKVETHFPPLVQTLSYYLFINHLSKIPLWIKTKQLPEDKISKYFPVFFPTRSPGIFLFFYFLFNNKTKRRKREKSCFLLCADFFLGYPSLLFFIFITKLKEEEERKEGKDIFPP